MLMKDTNESTSPTEKGDNMKTQHTPTPWKVGQPLGEGAIQIQSEGINSYGNFILAEIPNRVEEDQANASHIVKCVNLHDELVHALHVALAWVPSVIEREELVNLLAKAKGE
jgi:hypothetical protein